MIIMSKTLQQMMKEASRDSYIAKLLLSPLHTTSERVNYLDYQGKAITFLPSGKPHVENTDGTWAEEGRQSGKIARILRRAIHPAYLPLFTDVDYETLNNKILSQDITDLITVAVLEDGEQIKAAYNGYNYDKNTGTLQHSCMRYEFCQMFFGVYADYANMVVIKRTDNGLIVARALLWNIDGKTYMDRIYGPDWAVPALRSYASVNGWYYRKHNSYTYPTVFVDANGKSSRVRLTLQLSEYYKYMPYMDTLKYYCMDTNTLYNFKKSGVNLYVLQGTRGNDHSTANGHQYYEDFITAYLPAKSRYR